MKKNNLCQRITCGGSKLRKKINQYCCCIKYPKCLMFPCCRRRAELLLATDENTPEFTLKGLCFRGKVLKYEPGLKFSLALMFPDSIYKLRCELYGFREICDKIPDDKLVQLMPVNMDVYVVCHDFTLDGLLQVTLYEDRKKYDYHDMSMNEVLLIQTQVGANEEDIEKLFEIDLDK